MKIFKSKSKNAAYLGYRLVFPIFNPIRVFSGFRGYFKYFSDLHKFKKMSPNEKIKFSDLFPIVNENTPMTSFDAHYFYQQLWAFENILIKKSTHHFDISSTYQMSGYISKIVPCTFIDLRPINVDLKNLFTKKGDILKLDIKDSSCDSVSCLSVAEHIGLGRYGDEINPRGPQQACKELSRILSKGGTLYFSVPIGKPRICFNAHRVFDPADILTYFSGLKLLEFSVVDDNGNFLRNADYHKYADSNYCCGMYMFTK